MNILAFDTCFDACSVSAGRGLRSLTPRISTSFEPMAIGHAERLIPMIDETLDDACLRPQDLDRIAVTIGPGTFAGTRICVSAARALALATGADVVTISSLNLMAMCPAIPGDNGSELIIATDARRGEIYMQPIDRHTLHPIAEPRVVAAEAVVNLLGGGRVTFAGSGAQIAAAAAVNAGMEAVAIMPELLPDAFDMLFAAFAWPTATNVAPLYLRPPDAKPPAANTFLRQSVGAPNRVGRHGVAQ